MRRFAREGVFWRSAAVAAALSGVLAGLGGCSAEPAAVVPSQRVVRGQSAESDIHPENAAKGPDGGLVLTHDFGMLKPSEEVAHVFEVRNDSSRTWTIGRFINSCNCLAAKSSRQVIAPGQASSIEVRYTAVPRTADERRTVEVEFRDPDVPPARLIVLAQVREALTVEPRDLVFTRVARGNQSEAHLKAFNFSEATWDGLDVESSDPWLGVSAVVQSEGFAPARQAWRVTCAVDAGQLGAGRFTATVTLRAGGRDDIQMLIPVTVDVTAPVVAIPGQLHFGEVLAGVPASKQIMLRFADGIAPKDAAEITLRHDLAVDLSIECKKTDRFWEVTATLAPGLGVGDFLGTATIEFRDPEVEPISLPIYVKVVEP